jgi:heme/copper-type cytochrome/quinol oxidase subunit 1
MSGVPRRYYAIDEFQGRRPFFNSASIYVANILILIIAQLAFAINLVIGIIKSRRAAGSENINRL